MNSFLALVAGFAAAGVFESDSAQLAQAIATGRLSLQDFINQVQACTLALLCMKLEHPPMHAAWALSKLTSRSRGCLALGWHYLKPDHWGSIVADFMGLHVQQELMQGWAATLANFLLAGERQILFPHWAPLS